jgi:hypothetical protein
VAIPYDPTRSTYTNDLHRSDYENKGGTVSTARAGAVVVTLYRGSYKSALVRCRRALKAAGLQLSKKHGRYQPFCNTQTYTSGVNVCRVGVSSTIAVTVILTDSKGTPRHDSQEREERREMERRAIEVLRADGMPVDDRGWIECQWGCE